MSNTGSENHVRGTTPGQAKKVKTAILAFFLLLDQLQLLWMMSPIFP